MARIPKVSDEAKELTDRAIENSSVLKLPNNPSSAGYKAEAIKNAFVQPVKEATKAAFAEIDRLADAVSAEFAEEDAKVTEVQTRVNQVEGAVSVNEERILSAEETIETHTHDDRYYTESEVDEKLSKKADNHSHPYISTSQKGVSNGVATLDEGGKVPSSQLPSYVDDVLEYASRSGFPSAGESGKIYVATDTNKTYRWSGSTYVEIFSSVSLGETSSTAYRGDRGKIAYDHSTYAHAPSNAERNTIVGIKMNGFLISPDADRIVNIESEVESRVMQVLRFTDSFGKFVIPPNVEAHIPNLTFEAEIELGAPIAGYANEWVIIFGKVNGYDIEMPHISWQLGIAPTFSADRTEVRLWYAGDTLMGVWNDA